MMRHLSGGRYFGSKDCLKLVSVVTKLGSVENKANDGSMMNTTATTYDGYHCSTPTIVYDGYHIRPERCFSDVFSNLRCKMVGWDFEFLNFKI